MAAPILPAGQIVIQTIVRACQPKTTFYGATQATAPVHHAVGRGTRSIGGVLPIKTNHGFSNTNSLHPYPPAQVRSLRSWYPLGRTKSKAESEPRSGASCTPVLPAATAGWPNADRCRWSQTAVFRTPPATPHWSAPTTWSPHGAAPLTNRRCRTVRGGPAILVERRSTVHCASPVK